jgi:hypothetical protein
MALLGALILLICYVLMRSPVRVTQETYSRITRGMSLKEISAVVGGPPGDYTTGPTWDPVKQYRRTEEALTPTAGCSDRFVWDTDTGLLIVFCDRELGATAKKFERLERYPQSLIQSLDWRLGRCLDTLYPSWRGRVRE